MKLIDRKNKKEKSSGYALSKNAWEWQREEKKPVIIAVAIIILAIGSVIGLTMFLMNASHRDPGYYKVEAPANSSVPLYAHDLTFEHYFGGESLAIKYALEECAKVYGDNLLRIYKLTDSRNSYEECKNIAYLNAHIGEEVELDKELFDILISASELTRAGKFNMFAGALCSEWDDIIYSSAPEEFDPLVNDVQQRRIDNALQAAERYNDFFSFEIVDEAKCSVRFNTTSAYNEFARSGELGLVVLDLGRLRDAFIIDAICAIMEREGYDNGYITSASGVSKALSALNAEGPEYVSYSLVEDEAVPVYSLPMLPSSACCTLRTFGIGDEAGYYKLNTQDGERLRSPHFSMKSGEVNDNLLNACAFIEKGSAVEAYLSAQEYISASEFRLENSVAGASSPPNAPQIAFILKGESAIVCASESLVGRVKILEGQSLSIASKMLVID